MKSKLSILKSTSTELAKFYTDNPNFNILNFDFHDTSEVDQLKFGSADKQQLLGQLMTYQRLLRIDPDATVAKTLIDNQMTSAMKITSMSQSQFVSDMASKLGNNGAALAKTIYQSADAIRSRVTLMWGNAKDLTAPYFKAMATNNLAENVPTYFEALSSYQEMFGYLDFCSCSDCKSIYGPAAYLVDLLRLIDKAITVPNTTRQNTDNNIPAGLTFNDRRPDISKIELTCANTNDLLPYIHIVNEILENTVTKELSSNNLYQDLAQLTYPFNLPYNLPLNQIRTYIKQFNISLSDVYKNFALQGQVEYFSGREYLNFSVEQVNNLLPVAATDLPTYLTANFGTTISTSDLADLDHLGKLMRVSGLDRDQITDLIYQNLNAQELSDVSGEYTPSTWGTTLTLTQTGKTVNGTYDYKGGHLNGTLDGDTLRGFWYEDDLTPPNNMGTFEFEFSQDGSGFTGKYTLGYSGEWEKTAWNGTRNASTPSTIGEIPHKFFINKVLSGNNYLRISWNTQTADDEYEQIINLNIASLCNINQFIRLAANIGWSYADLDWVISSLGKSEISEELVSELASIKRLTTKFDLGPVELSTLWFDIKTIGRGDGPHSQAPFDLIFNNTTTNSDDGVPGSYHPKTIASDADYINPLYTDKLLPWVANMELYQKDVNDGTISAIPNDQLEYANQLILAVGASLDDLNTISSYFYPNQATLQLSMNVLSMFYRHVKLAQMLNITVGEYLVLLDLLGLGSAKKIQLTDLENLSKTMDWIEESSLTIYDLRYIINGKVNDYVETYYDEKTIGTFLASLRSVLSASLVTKKSLVFKSVTPNDGLQIFQQLLENGYLSNIGIFLKDPVTNIPTFSQIDVLKNAKVKQEVLDKINQLYELQKQKFAYQLAAFLGTKSDDLSVILEGTSIALSKAFYLREFLEEKLFEITLANIITGSPQKLNVANLQNAFATNNVTLSSNLTFDVQATNSWTITDNDSDTQYFLQSFDSGTTAKVFVYVDPDDTYDDKTAIGKFISQTARFIKLKAGVGLKLPQMGLIFDKPGIAGIANLSSLNIKDIKELEQFSLLESGFDDKKGLLVDFFETISGKGNNVVASDFEELKTIAGWDPNQTFFLAQKLFSDLQTSATISGIYQLNNCFKIGDVLGLDMYMLYELYSLNSMEANSNWDRFTSKSAQLLQAAKSQTTSEAWPTVYEQMHGALDEEKRDRLVDIALWKLGQQYTDIQTTNNLYEFLLIDVEMGSCRQVSRVKQALNSAQLYLQRSRLNLERNVVISTDDIPEVYWTWIMNFTLWQANRKVFLYPENYIDPTLRKSKTTLFSNLENQLQQGEITKEKVKEAYTKYLDDFATLANLKYSDAWHGTIHHPEAGAQETLVLFARTSAEPYDYYYITRTGDTIWSEWKKTNIKIDSKYVTPIYAFSKLFLFWVELKKLKQAQGNTGNAKKSETFQATIKYSFYNFSEDWIQPQVLMTDKVVFVDDKDNLSAPLSKFDAFDMESLYWQKVASVNVNTGNYKDKDLIPSDNTDEKVLVYYGPMMQANDRSASLTAGSAPDKSTDESSVFDFKTIVNDSVSYYNQSLAAKSYGYLPVNNALVLNDELEADFLLEKSPFTFMINDTFSETSAPVFRTNIDAYGKSIFLSMQENTFFNNYQEGMGSPAGYVAKATNATADSFICNVIDSSLSSQIFQRLKQPSVSILDANGAVQSFVEQTTVLLIASTIQITNVQARHVRNVLFELYNGSKIIFTNGKKDNTAIVPVKNQPGWSLLMSGKETFLVSNSKFSTLSSDLVVGTAFSVVNPKSFISNDISETLSGQIYTRLQQPSIDIVDSQGIVDLKTLENISVDLLAPNLNITIDQAQEIKNVMLSSGPVGLQYNSGNFTAEDNIYTLDFEVERLNTSAVHDLSRRLFTEGMDSLLSLEAQQAPQNVRMPYSNLGAGTNVGSPSVPYADQVTFTGPYGNYYWELFFHAPFLVANLLCTNQQFEDAMDWYRYIFNPTVPPNPITANSFVTNDISEDTSEKIFSRLQKPSVDLISSEGRVKKLAMQMNPELLGNSIQLDLHKAQEVLNILQNHYLPTPTSRYWQFYPFRYNTLETLKDQLSNKEAIAAYDTNPFDPHAIARLRMGAYEKTIVMHYIKNLQEWGDYEFSKYTWESITTATMLYVYADDLLGPKPESLGPCETENSVSFSNIQQRYKDDPDGIPQFLIDMENALGPSGKAPVINPQGRPFNELHTYFCVPENEQFIDYWSTIEDRLNKIRHCLNIDGQKQPLPLFQPPIDPMALVKAAAAGNNLLGVSSQLQPDIPPYRFDYMINKVKSVTATLTQLGETLLSVLEKNDAEGLALLKSSQEGALLNLTTLVKQKSIEDLQDQLAAMQQSKSNSQYRQEHYATLVKDGWNAGEIAEVTLMSAALPAQIVAQGIKGVTIAGYLAPNIFGFSDGGMKFGDAINAGASISEGIAAILNQSAQIAGTVAGYQRRSDEWSFQEQVAQNEVDQLTQQIASLNVKIAMSQQELVVHQKLIEQSDDQEKFLKDKFTSQQMYQWMMARVSSIYFQAFRTAIDMALAAQATYNFELNREDSFFTFSYWDNLYKGLLAGQSLMLSLEQMEKSYVENHHRRLEIEKTVSLKQLAPEEFLMFKWGHNKSGRLKGELNFNLGEDLFDFDFPGHYCRKIVSLSVSIPAVVGPYQNVNAILVQNNNMVLQKAEASAVDYMLSRGTKGYKGTEPPANILRQNWLPMQEIAISRGSDDSGLFQLNFQDERYLPFEGTGAVSSWTLKMPSDTNRIDFNSISDVIVTIKYSALDAGDEFAGQVKSLYKKKGSQYAYTKAKCLDLAQAFSGQWFQLMQTPPVNSKQSLSFPVTDNILLPNLDPTNVTLKTVSLQLNVAGASSGISGSGFLSLDVGASSVALPVTNNFVAPQDISSVTTPFDETWKLEFTIDSNTPKEILNTSGDALDPEKLKDMVLVITYESSVFS